MWFAADLGEPLWQVLDNRRSRAGKIVAEHLEAWGNPQMAGLVLLCLARSEWRNIGHQALRAWRGLPMFIGLLRQTPLALTAEVSRNVALLKRPDWLNAIDAGLTNIPAELRVHLPWWVGQMALSDDDKLNLLSRWARTPCPEVQRAVVYAMASIPSAAALNAMRSLSYGKGSAAAFARWFLAGRNVIPAGGPPAAGGGVRPQSGAEREGEFLLLWQRLDQAGSGERAPLLHELRRQFERWAPLLLERLHSADARERIEVLEVIDMAPVPPAFVPELRQLANDSSPVVRRLAAKILQQAPVSAGNSADSGGTEPVARSVSGAACAEGKA